MANPKRPIVSPPSAPTPAAPLDPYAEGMLAALRILKDTRDDMEAPIKQVRDTVGAAYIVLNGATHWGQTLVSTAESRIVRHLIDRGDEKEGA